MSNHLVLAARNVGLWAATVLLFCATAARAALVLPPVVLTDAAPHWPTASLSACMTPYQPKPSLFHVRITRMPQAGGGLVLDTSFRALCDGGRSGIERAQSYLAAQTRHDGKLVSTLGVVRTGVQVSVAPVAGANDGHSFIFTAEFRRLNALRDVTRNGLSIQLPDVSVRSLQETLSLGAGNSVFFVAGEYRIHVERSW